MAGIWVEALRAVPDPAVAERVEVLRAVPEIVVGPWGFEEGASGAKKSSLATLP